MINPFDKTFFRFLLGFSLMLSMSFAVIFLTGKYSHVIDGDTPAASIKK